MTKLKNEIKLIDQEKTLLRSALAVKTFELTELKNEQKEQIDKQIEDIELLQNEQNERIEQLQIIKKQQIEHLQHEQSEQKKQNGQNERQRLVGADAQLRPRNVKAWATLLKDLLNKKFASEASEQRIATLRLCLDDEVAKHVQDDVNIGENTLTDRRVFYALQKLTGPDVGRERTLQMALAVLPQGTLMEALPVTLIMDIVGRAEQDVVSAIQAEYDVETCLNLKFKNSLSLRQWNRSRLLLACYLNTDG
jgi:hypothetical protein